MTDKEYKDTMGGILMYGALGIISAWIGWGIVAGVFGGLMVLRGYPALRLPFIKENKDQNKG